ncbi:MAG: hypothetical protein LH629_09365, partial [Ignavibacteria bacterium]|nr:hypothetical protein [Ignavibacteria bacterium]
LLASITNISNKQLVIATSHLESLNNATIRYKQLQICYGFFKEYECVVMMGDFNFDNPQEHNANIVEGP